MFWNRKRQPPAPSMEQVLERVVFLEPNEQGQLRLVDADTGDDLCGWIYSPSSTGSTTWIAYSFHRKEWGG